MLLVLIAIVTYVVGSYCNRKKCCWFLLKSLHKMLVLFEFLYRLLVLILKIV